MDLKALMQKLEIIDKKQNLMEAEKKETTWTDKSGKKHPATQVKGDKYTGKEAEKEDKKKADEGITFNGSIANALLREFGLEEAGAEWAPTPEQEKWLGGANRQDPYIMNRMPGAKPPVSYFKDPADQALAKQMKFPAAAAAPTRSMAAPGNTDPTTGAVDYSLGGGKKPTALPQVPPTGGQAAQPAAAPAPATGALPPGKNEYGDDYNDGTSAPLQLPPGAEPEAGMTVAGDKTKPAVKKPAGGVAAGPKNPGTMAIQDYLNKKYGTNLKVDGQAGTATQTAISNLKGKVDSEEFKKIAGLGYAYNVKPGQGPGTISLGNPEFNKMMTDLGYDPKTGAPGAGAAAQPAAGAKGPTVAAAQGPTVAAAQGQQPGNPLNQKPGGQAAQPAAAPAPAAPTRGGATPIAKQQPKAAQPAAASGQQSPQQMLAQQDIARAREKAGKVAPTGTGSGTLQGGQAAQPADKVDLSVNNPAMDPTNNASKEVQDKLDAMRSQYKAVTPVRENVQSEDDLILARIRGFSVR